MKRTCEFCGRNFDTNTISKEQSTFYGDSICKDCWEEHPSSVRRTEAIRSIRTFAAEMKKPCDHFAVILNEESHLEKIVCGSVRRGITHNEMNTLMIWKEEQPKWLEFLHKDGINVDSLMDSQDIKIALNDEFYRDYLINPSSDILSSKLGFLRELVRKRGKTGLNIIGTLSGKIAAKGNYTDPINIEKYANEIILGFDIPVSVLCFYESLPPNIRAEILQYHNRGILESQEFATRFFSPEQESLSSITNGEKMQHSAHKRDAILSMLEGETLPFTILNIDIVRSSEVVTRLSEEQVKDYYETFLERTTELIQGYGGFVLKYVGDGIIAFFPRYIQGMRLAQNAVLCGLSVFDILKNSINPYLAEKKIPPIECRVSADYGQVRVLKIRSDYGSSAIDLFGKPMNSATKILHFAKPGQMVIGDGLFSRLKEIGEDIFDFKLVNRWDPFGKHDYPVYVIRRKS